MQKDMPNFFVEAVTVADGRVHTETREVVVPPEKRVLNVEVAAVAAGVSAGPEGDGEGQADRLLRQAVRRLDGAERSTTRASSTSPAARTCRRSGVLLEMAAASLSADRIEPGALAAATCCATTRSAWPTSASSARRWWRRWQKAKGGGRRGRRHCRTACEAAAAAAARPRADCGGRRRMAKRDATRAKADGREGRREEAGAERTRRAGQPPAAGADAGRPQELRRHRLLGGVADHRQGRHGRGRR